MNSSLVLVCMNFVHITSVMNYLLYQSSWKIDRENFKSQSGLRLIWNFFHEEYRIFDRKNFKILSRELMNVKTIGFSVSVGLNFKSYMQYMT